MMKGVRAAGCDRKQCGLLRRPPSCRVECNTADTHKGRALVGRIPRASRSHPPQVLRARVGKAGVQPARPLRPHRSGCALEKPAGSWPSERRACVMGNKRSQRRRTPCAMAR